MKNIQTKITILSVATFTLFAFVGIANASAVSLYASPATLTKNAGESFNVSVGVSTGGSKVCVVEGTVAFNNLSCQSITVADGLMAQTSPTCAKPTFSIGIPSCATADQALFTINTKAGTAGSATISFNTVDIIGEGNSLGSASSNGNYTINALTVTPVVTAPAATPKKAVVPTAVKTTPKAEVAPVKIEPAKETSTAKEGKANNEVLQLAATAQAVPQDNGRIIGWGISGIIGFILGYAACALKNKKAKA